MLLITGMESIPADFQTKPRLFSGKTKLDSTITRNRFNLLIAKPVKQIASAAFDEF